MVNVTWIIERDVFHTETFENMIAYLEQRNIDHHVVRVIPFIHEIEGKVPDVHNPVIVYGSIGAQVLAKRHGWLPGVWTNRGLDETVLASKLGPDFLNFEHMPLKFKNVLENTPWNLFFIKPDTDTKEFAGTVLSKDRFNDWQTKMLESGYFSGDTIFETPVIVSPVKALGCEWRIIIVNKKVCEFSCYRQYQRVMPERWAPDHVLEFAERMAGKHSPVPIFVLDIAETEEGLKVVEYNTFNSSGFYKCDIKKIIDDVTNYVKNNFM